MTETNDRETATIKLSDQCEREDSDDVHNAEEVRFDEPGDLGISLRVADDGAVVVGKLLQLRGYGELSCPTLHPGDVLVAIDNTAVIDLSFADVMLKLRATVNSRPTRLEFVAVDRFESADNAVARWQHNKSFSHVPRGDDPRFREGEFEVMFESLQPTGLRFTESYIMTSPLKLAHLEFALLRAMGFNDLRTAEISREALLDSILVRIGEESVLGAPVDDVMDLLYDPDSFPKALWFGRTANLQGDYQVMTLTTREQLKWLCFVPVEVMMEVPVVSYAALATFPPAGFGANVVSRRRTRSDGISEDQYLMAINGFPTLRISSSSTFTDNSGTTNEEEGIVSVVNTSLDVLLSYKRTLRFRDLKAYRQEFLAHAPLSPWQRRRRTQIGTPLGSVRTNAIFTSPSARLRHDLVKERWELSGASVDSAVEIEHQHQTFCQILLDRAVRDELREWPLSDQPGCSSGSSQIISSTSQRRPPIKGYHGLANCEGVREFTPLVSDDVKCVVVPDNERPIGIQLETDIQANGRPIFKSFVRCDGPALRSGSVKVGDRILAVNGVAIDKIPMPLLVRILRGEHAAVVGQEQTAAVSQFTQEEDPRSGSAVQCRVLRLARGEDPHSQFHTPGLFGQAKRFLALSKARLAIWKSSQLKASDIE